MAVGCGRPALPSDVFSAGTGFGCDGEDCPLTQRPLQNQSRKEVEPSVNSQMVQTSNGSNVGVTVSQGTAAAESVFSLFSAQIFVGKSNIEL